MNNQNFVTGLHVYQSNNKYILLDAYTPSFYVISRQIFDFISTQSYKNISPSDTTIVNQLIHEGLVTQNIPRKYSPSELEEPIELKTLFILNTYNCNFSCKYCHIMNNNPNLRKMDLSPELLQEYIDYFYTQSNAKNKNIIFFGGEPLLNFSVIEHAVAYIFNKYKDTPEFTIFTNGSLITSTIAQKISKLKIKVIVSIDGYKAIHDKMRIFNNKKGTFDRVLNGFNLLKTYDCIAGISCSVGTHNVDLLDEVCKYFIDNLRPSNIGFNMLHKVLEPTPPQPQISHVNRMILKAYDLCSDHGLYVVHAVNRLRPLVEKRPRIKDCAAYGKQIVVTPDCRIGTCEVFSTSQQFFIPFNKNIMISDNTILKDWSKRFVFNFEGCQDCEAITLCGGGCAYDSFLANGNIHTPDDRVCDQSSQFLKWSIKKLFTYTDVFNLEEKIHIKEFPSSCMHSLFGNLKTDSEEYPLTNYHSSLNVNILK